VILRHSFEPLDNARLAHLCGSVDENLRQIEATLGVDVSRRHEFFRVEGPKARAESAMALLQRLYEAASRPVGAEQVQLALVQAARDLPAAPVPAAAAAKSARKGGVATRGGEPASTSAAQNDGASSADKGNGGGDAPSPPLSTRRPDLMGRTPNQLTYLHNILGHDITLGIGPAGTGKTFLAVACAVDALERSAVQRIILTRPAVEAGERLGFLPGDLAQKVDPYLRPLYDALYDLMGADKVARAFDKGLLEIAPLAFMRGRTLNHAFVILDEAQNTTAEQMKMFLTRLGFGSKAVITGDVSQIDLPRGTESGLIDAERVLRRVRGIATTHFGSADVVRHPLVARIVEAYDAARLDGA
jgi:phosphate starvation-inducible protein PhoH and related proteins